MNFEKVSFDSEIFLVEVGLPRFEYKYQKQERAFIGQCDYCSTTKLLTIQCVCKRARYCSEMH